MLTDENSIINDQHENTKIEEKIWNWKHNRRT